MTDATAPKLIYLTLPEAETPILNVVLSEGADGGGVLVRFVLTHKQVLALLAQLADAAQRGEK